MKVRLFFEGAGLAILALLPAMWVFLLPDHLVAYHNPRPVSTVAGALALDLFIATAVAFLLFALLEHLDRPWISIVWAAVIAWVAVRAINVVIFFLNYYDVENVPGRKQKAAIQLVICVAVFLLWWRFRGKFQACVRTVKMGLALLGCCIVWMLPQMVLFALHVPAPDVSAFIKPELAAAQPSSGRIVWILFDELSYNQLFDHRQPDIQLPNFDRLRNKSVIFANVQPAGSFTDIIIPSLFLGRELDAIRSSFHGDLYVHPKKGRRWELFHANETLFDDARQSGWSTGIAGWYNPYCRILSSVLDWCYWDAINPYEHGLSDQKSTLANAYGFFRDLTLSRITGPAAALQFAISIHAQEYNNMLSAATALVRDERVRFAFIHLPVPHPPGMYDRHTHAFSGRGTYLDNLVLADRTLGVLLDEAEKTASASHTTVIVSSDHSWRVGMWRMNSTTWTPEEERATGGEFDPRPVLMVHFPGETSGETISRPFAEIKTRKVVDSMLQEKVRSESDLNQWLNWK
jgi:hypothetical protein